MSTIAQQSAGQGPAERPPSDGSPVRLGAVSYLNTLPLIEGLGKLRDITLTLTAPSRLIDLLMEGSVDLALASVIDAQRAQSPVAFVPSGMIGCDGPTLTVRLFSKSPVESLTRVHADIDSHTSIALLRVIFAERWGRQPAIVDFDVDAFRAAHADPSDNWPDAVLMIGDKVITDSPPAVLYPHQLDLGEAWKSLTGLPFVYAIWMCRDEMIDAPAIANAAAVLDRQRRHNQTRLDWIVARRASSRGWPADLAAHYLAGLLRFDVTDVHRAAIARFFELAAKHGVLARRRDIRWRDV